MGKPSSSTLKPSDFADFTPERVIALLRQSLGSKAQIATAIAAVALASIGPQGPTPGNDLIATAMEVLARAGTPLSGDFLWQAAEHARNARIRIEAIRRVGPFATAERRKMLRKWAADGFGPIANFHNDEVRLDSIQEASLTALGETKDVTQDDIEAVVLALTRPVDPKTFSRKVFSAATEAYWKIGDVASLPRLVSSLSNRQPGDIVLSLTSLAAKFSARELKPFADALRSSLRQHAQQWQDDPDLVSRLVTLSEKLSTPEFLQEWASEYGKDGLHKGRGEVTSKLLETFEEPTEALARALTTLAQWPQNLSADGAVLRGLTQCARAAHGKLIARILIEQRHDDRRQLVESGGILGLYESSEGAFADICEAISASKDHESRRRLAASVAIGAMIAASGTASAGAKVTLDKQTMATRGAKHDAREHQETLDQGVKEIERLEPSRNPVVLVARLLCPPTSSPGAMAIVENLARPDDPLARYVIRVVIGEAGRAGILASEAPMLARFEEFMLMAERQEPPLRTALEAALAAEAMVDGRLNRYAIDLMQRRGLPFASAAQNALNRIQTVEDAQFLLDRLHDEGVSAVGVLMKEVNFHREGNEELTVFVRGRAIALLTKVLAQNGDQKRRNAFAEQLHQRFHDLPAVREAAYRACGELGTFVSIKPLRERLPTETAAALKAAINEARIALRNRLVQQKPQQAKPDDINQWLGFVADLGDSVLLPHVTGYLSPPHADHTVQHSALNAVMQMPDPKSLDVVKKFTNDTAPQGETLALARRARMVLEDRKDVDLFDVLGAFYQADAEVLDPEILYEQLLGAPLLSGVAKRLKNTQDLWQDGHWDEFITEVSAVMEALVGHVFRKRYTQMSVDRDRAEKLARGNYMGMLNLTEFRTTYGKLQAHCNTIYSFRRNSPTAHAMNQDGSAKLEATQNEAEYVRGEFLVAFAEAVKVLR